MASDGLFRPCIIVPHFNHERELATWLADLAGAELPVVVVDDGSDEASKATLKTLLAPYPSIELIERTDNGGKGAASVQAMRWAHARGFTHVVSMDADGQHHLPDLPRFIDAAKNCPSAVISGAPQFGDDIPTSRLHGRKITNLLVRIEAGRFDLTDAMCGYRLYPLAECLPLLEQLGRRTHMQFDVELLVRAAWAGLPVHYIATPVRYPSGGRSHFRMVADNARLTAMHVRLLLAGLFWHLPSRALAAPSRKVSAT